MRQNDGTRGSRRAMHAMHAMQMVFLGLAVAGATLAGGCTPWATYPSIAGSTGLDEPWLSPIPDVIAQALRFAHFDDGAEGEIVFNLPEGAPPLVYERVIDRLASGGDQQARPMNSSDEVAYHVTEVRVRTVESEVDLIHRDARGEPQQMTVSVNRNLLSGFFVSDVRFWRYSVEEPPPHFMPPPVETTGVWDQSDGAPETLGAGDGAGSVDAAENGSPYDQ